MTIVDRGQGRPIVLVPSLQGRWEYLGPAVDALAQSNRVITFSFRDAPGAGPGADATRALDSLADQIEAVLDHCGLSSATICGISFGGRVALRFAARRPERTDALILASVPGPGWHLKRSHRWMARRPRLLAPLFFAALPGRLWAEIATAIPDRRLRRAFVRRQLGMVLRAPMSPTAMAARALLIDGMETGPDCAAVSVPTLVLTGEAALDHVVPAEGSCGFAQCIAGSRAMMLERTGHLGCITQPAAFAKLVSEFADASGGPARSS